MESFTIILSISSWSFVPLLPFLHPFCSHENKFVFSRCSYNFKLRFPVINFQIKDRQVIGLKFDTKFPFWISFIQRKVFTGNHSFRQVIFFEASIQLKPYTVVQITQVFDPVSLHTIRPWAYPVRHFSYLLPYFLKFQYVCHLVMSVLPVYSIPSSINPCFLCPSLLGPIYHSKNVYSPLNLVSHFLFVFLPICWAISSGLIHIIVSACTDLPYCHGRSALLQDLSFLHWTFSPALIWRLHFAIPFVSFYVIVLTLCVIPSASRKFFFANFVVCFPSSACFCNPSS